MELSLLRPWWLAALPLIALSWWWRGRAKTQRSPWRHACDPALLQVLLVAPNESTSSSTRRHLILLLSAALALALAGPSLERIPEEGLRDEAALIIGLDLSASMLTQDTEPSRIERARFKIMDVLRARRAGDTALLVYAADAFAVTPLTFDMATINAMLPALSPQIMPAQGSSTRAAINLAAELLARADREEGDLLLVTDGIGPEAPDMLAAQAREAGLAVSVLAVGTEDGGRVPAMNGIDYLLDSTGRPVTARLDPVPLRRLAGLTNGRFQQTGPNDTDLERLVAFLDERIGRRQQTTDQTTPARWRDPGPWLVFLALLPAALLFRRDLLVSVSLVVGLFSFSAPASATDPLEWFRNKDQRALAAWQRGDFEEAAASFKDTRWRAATAYRLDSLQEALDLYDTLDDVESLYNRANTLVLLGSFNEALATYEQVLTRAPDHEDAAHNRNEVLKMLQALMPKGESTSPGDGDVNDSGDDSERNAKRKQQPPPPPEDVPASAQAQPQPSAPITNTPPPGGSEGEQKARTQDATSTEVGGPKPELDERLLADEQWLRRVPDDPAGLLRRKFREQYRQRGGQSDYRGDPW